jgi:hypothetical protein
MRRDPEAPEVTGSGKQRDRRIGSTSPSLGTPDCYGIVCELIFSVQLRVVRGHRSFTPFAEGRKGSYRAIAMYADIRTAA